jgi:hypothetical protein
VSGTRAPSKRSRETRKERELRHSAEAQVFVAQHRAEVAAYRAKRIREALIGSGALIALAAAVSFWVFRIAQSVTSPQMTWTIALGARNGGFFDFVAETPEAWLLALKVQLIPVFLAVISLARTTWRKKNWPGNSAMWFGIGIAPGLAIGVVLGFYADSIGQHGEDGLALLAAFAPEGLPLVAFFGFGACVVIADKIKKRRNGTARKRG